MSLLIGYFEGLDAERAIAWRAADSFRLREFLGLVLPDAPPDDSTISRTGRLIDLEKHRGVHVRVPAACRNPFLLPSNTRLAIGATKSQGESLKPKNGTKLSGVLGPC
jgi:transposase